MDSSYYDRQAASECKKLEGLMRRRADEDKLAARAEEAASKADIAATKASSSSQARSKISEAARKRNDAQKHREKAAKIAKDMADCQAKVHRHEGQAADARTKEARKTRESQEREQRKADRAQRDAEREREREVIAQRARELASQREVVRLRQRTDELEQALQAARQVAPHRIVALFMAGTPEASEDDAKPLRLDREIHEVDQKVRASEYRDQIRFETVQATHIRDILDALNRYDPDIVHFSGHGAGDALLFEGPDGRPQELSNEQLALLLTAVRKPVRLVVFNSCLSAAQAAMATNFIDAAIGMEEPINDETAKTFAGQLYDSLAAGTALARAFEQAKAQAAVLDDDSGRPRLYVRDGVDAEEMILVAPFEAQEAA